MKTCYAFGAVCILMVLVACAGKTDRTLNDFSSKVDALEEKSATMDLQSPEIQQLQGELNTLMDQISAMDLSDEQQARLTGIALKLQVVSMALQETSSKNILQSLDSIQKGLDSIGTGLESLDTLTYSGN